MNQESVGLIAIIDDDVLVQEGLGDCMESAGYSVESFSSAEGFLASGQTQSAACLVVDVQLPGITGLELQRRLAEAGNRVPVVFVSAHASDENRELAVRQGAASFLSKPLRREELLNAISAAIRR